MHVRTHSSLLSIAFAACSFLFNPSNAIAASTGTVQMSSAAYSATETVNSVTVIVTRTGGSSGQATIAYNTKTATAAVGVDYMGAQGTLTWANGDSAAKTVTITIHHPSGFTGTKYFYFQLGTPYGTTLGSITQSTISLVAPTTASSVAFSAASYSVAATGKTITISVKRTGTSGAASIHYATHTGTAIVSTNYTGTSGNLNWADGDASSKSFTVSIINTASSVATKAFSVTLTSPTGAALGTPNTATVTITYVVASNGTGPAAALAAKLGRPARLLIGLGSVQPSDVTSQALKIDIYDQYLSYDWWDWNSPPCDYACVVAAKADSVGAIPMYTYYEMENNGENNMSVLTDNSFMSTYWTRMRQMYQSIATDNKPALVHLEPDFWGYTERAAPNADPAQIPVLVSINADCATLPNNVVGLASCMLKMARQYAPKAYLGFAYSTWGGNSDAEVVAYMHKVGAQNGDFLPVETLDRDVGCFELSPQPSYCNRPGAGVYWDETNKTHPNFQDHLASVQTYRTGLGNLPVIWWQTPLGVPSTTAGGTDFHYRDNREHYFLTHPAELTAVGGLGAVFSAGEGHQTLISTDGGQFQSLSGEYLAAPAKLP